MNTKTDTDPDSPTFGSRLVYDENGTLIGTWAQYLDRQAEPGEDFDIVLEEVLPSTKPDPAPAPTPKLDAAIARHVTKHKLLSTQQLLNKPEPPWFIENLVPHSARMVIHGEPGSKKTFIALDLAVCAQHGIPWHGKAIAQGPALYVLGEGTSFIGRRLKALAHGKNMAPEDIKVTWMDEPLNIYTATDEEIKLWAGFVRHFKFKYLFFDTLSMNTAGMEENSAKDMEAALARATKIAGGATSGCMVILVHHNTKKGDMRGSSALLGNCDTIIEVKADSSNALVSILRSDKIRDAEGFSGLAVTFKEHEESESIYIETVGSKAASTTKRQLIIKAILSQPGVFTRADVCCTVGDGGSTQDAYTSLLADGSIYKETRANPKQGRGHSKMIEVLFVDTAACPFEDLP